MKPSAIVDIMLPEPTLSFTIPSIHDDAKLECRIYHPLSLSANPNAPPWRKHAAIVAHPYAVLGGCHDDAVVETMAAALLSQGFLVGTFNFRGAGKSTGRTSWTARPERSDYMSFVGFVYYYLHYLDPFQQCQDPNSPDPNSPDSLPSPRSSARTSRRPSAAPLSSPPVFLQCGYSYGAIITKHLPPLNNILGYFTEPKTASAAADIRLRAQHLADRQNLILASARAAISESNRSMPRRKSPNSGIRVGGDEDKRRSQDHGGRRSFAIDAEERIRAGVADLMKKTRKHQLHIHWQKSQHADEGSELPPARAAQLDEEKEPDHLPPLTDLMEPLVAYLLVSPPLGWPTSLMTLGLASPGSCLLGKSSKHCQGKARGDWPAESKPEKQKLTENHTLAIYGDTDVFVCVKKFRHWATKLQSGPGSKFRAHEISTAGHFYLEEGAMQRVHDSVTAFSVGLLAAVDTSGP